MTLVRSSITHAETMDQVYRHQRHIYDLTRKYYLIGRDKLIAGLKAPPGGAILELGCGTGRNLLAAARMNPAVACYGVDISEQMLSSAGAAAARAGLTRQIFFAHGDAESFDARSCFSVSGFDRIYLSYCLSMVPDWPKALERAMEQVARTGEVHIVDFGDMARWPRFVHGPFRAWLAKFQVEPRDNLNAAARELARKHGFTMSFEQLLGGYAWLIILKRAGRAR